MLFESDDAPGDAVDWRELAHYPSHSAAEIDAAYLRSHGLQARAWVFNNIPTEACGVRLMVESGAEDRARWLLKLEPVSEAELDFLATGKLPEAEA